MIRYTEKGIGLHRAVEAAGHWIRQQNGEWIVSDEHAVQAIVDAFTVADHAEAVIDEIEAHAKALLDRRAAGKSVVQIAKEPIKAVEADAITKGGSAPTLEVEATARGITVEELAAKVRAKIDVESVIVGVLGKHKDALRAMRSHAEVQSYDWRTGWPDV